MADNPFLTPANPMQLLQQAQQVPEELQPELRGITRQQQLANMLTQQAFQQPNQGQMVSGRYVAPSFFQGIAPMVNAYLGQRASEQADTKQALLAEKLRQGGDAEMQQFNQLLAEGTPEARTKAIQYAQTAKYSPLLRNIGAEMLKPQKLGEGDVLAIPGLPQGMGTIAIGGEKLSPEIRTAAQMLGLPADTSKWTPQQTQAVNQQIMNLKRAGATNVSVSTGNQLGGTFGKLYGEDAFNLFTQARNAPNQIQDAQRTISLIDSGAMTGTGADFKLKAAKFFNVAGANNDEIIKNTELLAANRGKQLLANAKSSGLAGSQGLTEGERKFLSDAEGGSINLNASTLKAMATLEMKVAQRNQMLWNDTIKTLPPEVIQVTGVKPVQVFEFPPEGVSQAQWNAMTEDQKSKFRTAK